ncbi:DUF6090 family protein [Winogradskyella sp. SYSU M77433]|uniref:DUF6090 family protein n=1 Tax=Winogradskyella sp. SYSU M77433 TaxID=3042722 RepID=UPI00247FD804|nr:DUF6090 family protein [Winogradskyella sp. SYSU M77433]MDH7914454.1 DUF6090 family protein [Winogradskyella sp. SYSU M77433]
MIRFFRKMRQNLVAKNRFSKYLLYAIGEIILVVIGILLALQINSWNQQRIEDKKEEELLSDLKSEFQYNLTELEESIKINKKVSQSCIELTVIIRSNTIGKNSQKVDELLIAIGNFNSFDARTGVSNEIVNSDKLSYLKNEELRRQLSNWLTTIVDCEEDILFRSDNYTINLIPFLMKRFPLANGELTKKLAFDKNNYLEAYKESSPFKYNLPQEDLMEFENQIWHHKHNQDYVAVNELNLKDFILTTIDMIEKQLKENE